LGLFTPGTEAVYYRPEKKKSPGRGAEGAAKGTLALYQRSASARLGRFAPFDQLQLHPPTGTSRRDQGSAQRSDL